MSAHIKHPNIPLHPVEKSSQIEAIGHQGTTLAVKFKNGGTYHYSGVSAAQFEELKTAESVGSHLHKHFTGKHLGDKHPYVKLPNEH